ncbi:MAG: ribbon-helix-helix protein, CopG family, partial [Candidatus Bathyarchaeia archaeon]
RKGRNVSIYLRAEDLELLDRICMKLKITRSEFIHDMFEWLRKVALVLSEAMEKDNPEPLMIMLSNMLVDFSKYKDKVKDLKKLMEI